jgi:putative intracellular protease/amidase
MFRAIIRLNRQSKNYSTKKDKMVKKALVLISEYTEESEAVIPVDVLRRAGVECLIAGVDTAQAVACATFKWHVPLLSGTCHRCHHSVDFNLVDIDLNSTLTGPGVLARCL